MILGKLYSLRMASDDINRGLQPKHNTLIPSNLWIPYCYYTSCVFTWSNLWIPYCYYTSCVFIWSPHNNDMVGASVHASST